ncbi:hypothetical protein PG999_006285 [Apiospora kogelbergensis]|uniref:HMG box domain-containing protein n=1 Tax=Apiospora kogelbergensis TaxID=1337665 RepID=A0AAW0QT74_9PEZI
MPFFVGRIVAHRLASSVAATSSSRLVVAKQLGRVSGSPLLRAGFVRAYATPGRPKKSDTDSSTQSAGRSRKTADGAAPKKVTAAKKTTATKATTKATAKKATGTSKSPKAKKTSPPPKKKKVLTDKQKAAKELSKARKEKAELKQKALFTEPKNLPRTAWTVYMTREAAGGGFEGDMVAKMPTIANAFKALSSSELEIADAQHARNLLRRKFGYPKANASHKIRDERQPKNPRSAYIYYFRARFGSGGFANVKVTEALKSIAQEWKTLPAVERQPFDDLAAADLTRYKKQVAETLHR